VTPSEDPVPCHAPALQRDRHHHTPKNRLLLPAFGSLAQIVFPLRSPRSEPQGDRNRVQAEGSRRTPAALVSDTTSGARLRQPARALAVSRRRSPL